MANRKNRPIAVAKESELGIVQASDPVNHPKHYTTGNIECIEYLIDQNFGFFAGTIVKYITRYRTKNGIEDLRKARWYLDRMIKELEVGKPVS